jgi:hypothetical protein
MAQITAVMARGQRRVRREKGPLGEVGSGMKKGPEGPLFALLR